MLIAGIGCGAFVPPAPISGFRDGHWLPAMPGCGRNRRTNTRGRNCVGDESRLASIWIVNRSLFSRPNMKITLSGAAYCVFMGLLAPQATHAERPLVIAHRGASSDAPENTLAAITLGFEQGADFVEIDLHLTADGEIVVIHDATTKRTGDADLEVSKHALADLKRVDVGAFKGPQWAGERIPTLEDALAAVPAGRGLFLELKCGEQILPHLANVIERSSLSTEQIVLIGFDLPTISGAKRRLPKHRAYWLVDFKQDAATGTWKPTRRDVLQRAAGSVDGVNLRACDAVDAEFTAQAKAVGFPVYVWTVNDPVLTDRMRNAGVAGITTDRPKRLVEQLAAPRGAPHR